MTFLLARSGHTGLLYFHNVASFRRNRNYSRRRRERRHKKNHFEKSQLELSNVIIPGHRTETCIFQPRGPRHTGFTPRFSPFWVFKDSTDAHKHTLFNADAQR